MMINNEFLRLPLSLTGFASDFSAMQLDLIMLIIRRQRDGRGELLKSVLASHKLNLNWHRAKQAIEPFILPSLILGGYHLPLLQRFTIGRGKISFELYPGLAEQFGALQKNVFRLFINDFFNLKTKYGKLLYFSGIRWLGTGKYHVFKIDLSLNWSVNLNYLKHAANFKNRVLMPAIHDCFDNSGTYFHLVKEDKKTESFHFELKQRAQLKLFEENPSIEHALRSIPGQLSDFQINYICQVADEKAIYKMLFAMNLARTSGKILTSPAAYFLGMVNKCYPQNNG